MAPRYAFQTDDDLQDYLREADVVERWIEAGAPYRLDLDMAAKLYGDVPAVDLAPLTVEQAAERLQVGHAYVRRRLDALAAMEPAGAWRVGTGARAPWRIVPAALDKLREAGTVEPKPASPTRGNRKSQPKKRSATRWEV